jgi:uncharacterized protein with HEPN domain
MLSDQSRVRLVDIRHNIHLVRQWIAGLDFEQFAQDTMRVYAVVRALEIVSEASRGVEADVKARHPDIDWARMAGAGNIYRHDYDDVVEQFVWTTARNSLPPLLAAVDSELSR